MATKISSLLGSRFTGSTGPAGSITIGTVTSGGTASVTNSGTDQAAILNFNLPIGTFNWPQAGIPISTGSNWTFSLTAPTTSIVGVDDSQTLTNKTISGANNTIKYNEVMTIALSDESTSAITTGTAKLTFRAPFAMTLYQIPRASLSTASSSGNPEVNINVNGVSIFSTNLTIDSGQKTSTTATTAAVLSTTSIADDAEITFDIVTAGTDAKGLKVTLYYRRT